MAYASASGRLPMETASKTAYMGLMQHPLVQQQVRRLQSMTAQGNSHPIGAALQWKALPTEPTAVTDVIVCDGSNYTSTVDDSQIAFLRATILRLPTDSSGISLHPYAIANYFHDHSETVAGVLPVMVPCVSLRKFSLLLRRSIFEIVSNNPAILDTFCWLFRRGWLPNPASHLTVVCPHCGEKLRFENISTVTCPTCSETVFITDLLQFDRDISDTLYDPFASTRVTSVLEFLMLLTSMRNMFEHAPEKLPCTLFLHDGPLSIGGHYQRLFVPLREFLIYAADLGTPIMFCGVEKSSIFTSHLVAIDCNRLPRRNQYAVPTRDYIDRHIRGTIDQYGHYYGERNVLGEKVFLIAEQQSRYVVSIPTVEQRSQEGPDPEQLICRDVILRTLCSLVSPVYDNALYPIVCANSQVSISHSPGGRMLDLMVQNKM